VGGNRIYRAVGHRFVQGWMKAEVLSMLAGIDVAQRTDGVDGPVAEIGVHHGKLFIGLQLSQRGDGSALAIDLFDDQDLNVDKSGNGDYKRLVRNVRRWSTTEGLVVHQGDSTKLEPDHLVELAGGAVRIFSVDGGHTADVVCSDMRLAEATLHTGGVVVADDVFNEWWPGVAVGTLRYLSEGGGLQPFVIGFNKVLFSRPEYCDRYRDAVISAFADRPLIEPKRSMFAGHEVAVLCRLTTTPRHLLRHNRLARPPYDLVRKQLGRQRAKSRGLGAIVDARTSKAD
jgi:hypothetical protein